MDQTTPAIGLILWTILTIGILGMIVYGILKLSQKDNIPPSSKLMWLLLILFVPFLGVVLFLNSNKKTTD